MTNQRRTLTHSIASTFLNCQRKYYYRYVLNLRRKNRPAYYSVGSAFHAGLEYQDPEAAVAYLQQDEVANQWEADDLRIKISTVRGMVAGALEAWDYEFEDFYPEQEYELPIRNPETGYPSRTFVDAGKMDGVVRLDDGLWLIEYKTASRISSAYFERLYLDAQITRYYRAAQIIYGQPLNGVIYRVAKKPAIRQRKNESLREFCERLEADFRERPDFYFYEEKLYRSDSDLADFEWDLWSVATEIRRSERDEYFPKNTSRCAEYGGCPFIPICTGEHGWENLYETAERNPELGDDEFEYEYAEGAD